MHARFLEIPLEIRLAIYNAFLQDHQIVQDKQQPNNDHIRFLHTCRQVYREADHTFRQYVSLYRETQIFKFNYYSTDTQKAQVRWADLANDGRVIEYINTGQLEPISGLYLALEGMVHLQRIRVFDVRGTRYAPTGPHLRYHLLFERSMFPLAGSFQFNPKIISYELFLNPRSRVVPFQVLSADSIHTLRLSGECRLSKVQNVPSLRHLTIHGVTGIYFDHADLGECFPEAKLESFIYAQGHRLGFEIRDHHLESLVNGPGARLTKLVLLGCSKLTSGAILSCLKSLVNLRYCALSLITVKDFDENFALAIPGSMVVFKLQVTHAWYAIPMISQEREICDVLERDVMQRKPPLEAMHISMHSEVMNEDGRTERWKSIASEAGLTLHLGPWEDSQET